MLLRDAALDALGEQRLGVRGGRVGAGVREVEELLVLERLRRRAVVGPVGVELEELLDALEDHDERAQAAGDPGRQAGRGQHRDGGRRDDLHDLDAHVPALVAPGAVRVPRICSSRRCHEADEAAPRRARSPRPRRRQRRLRDGRRRRAHRRTPLFMCSSLSTSPPGGSVSESTSGRRLCVRAHDLVPLRAPKAGQNLHRACNRARAAPVGSGPRVPRRILILSWEYPPIVEGGLARHVRKLSEGLVEHGRGGPRAHARARSATCPRRSAPACACTACPSPRRRATSTSSWPGSRA